MASMFLTLGLAAAGGYGKFRPDFSVIESLARLQEVQAGQLPGELSQRPRLQGPLILEGEVTSGTSSSLAAAYRGPLRIVQDEQAYAEITAFKDPTGTLPLQWEGTSAEWFNSTVISTRSFMGLVDRGIKYALLTGGFLPTSPFAWLIAARDGGEVTFEGRSLHEWSLDVGVTSMALLVDDETGSPVVMWTNSTVSPGEARWQRALFSSYQPNVTDPTFWSTFKEDEFLHPPVCPTPSTGAAPVNKTFYVFHPADNFDIAGQDVADEHGDASFVCIDAIQDYVQSKKVASYQWITQWVIELQPVFGQYQNCNGYPPKCIGRNNLHVGHESAYNMGLGSALDRQCGSNPLVGEWYSMPAGGQCQEGERPGDGRCTWRKVQRVKTINGTCLHNGNAFRDLCLKDRRLPFPTARQHYANAFASDEPSQGGCPPIAVPPPATASIVVV